MTNSASDSNSEFVNVTLKSPPHLGFPHASNSHRINLNVKESVYVQVLHYIKAVLKLKIQGKLRLIFCGKVLSEVDSLDSFKLNTIATNNYIIHIFSQKFIPMEEEFNCTEAPTLETATKMSIPSKIFILDESNNPFSEENSSNKTTNFESAYQKVTQSILSKPTRSNDDQIRDTTISYENTQSIRTHPTNPDNTQIQLTHSSENQVESSQSSMNERMQSLSASRANLQQYMHQQQELIKKFLQLQKLRQRHVQGQTTSQSENNSNITSSSDDSMLINDSVDELRVESEIDEETNVRPDINVNNIEENNPNAIPQNMNPFNNMNTIKILIKIMLITFIMTYSRGGLRYYLRVFTAICAAFLLYSFIFRGQGFTQLGHSSTYSPSSKLDSTLYGIYLFFVSLHPSYVPKPIPETEGSENSRDE